MKNIKSCSVVGGGTAGFVSALIIKTRFPDVDVRVIRSTKIGIIGVGEGSTEHWAEFMGYIGKNFKDIIVECDATFKAGIMFEGWAEQDYLHSTSADFDKLNGQYHHIYGNIISQERPKREMNPTRAWRSRLPSLFADEDNLTAPFNQFHFNTQKLNDFLTRTAIEKGIDVIDDEIVDATISEEGDIKTIKGLKQEYTSDFYIDCSGFRRVLITKLGSTWKSYSEYLKMKSAIVFPIEEQSNIPMWTLAKAMDYGWLFRIPVYGRYGNGYIFDTDYIDADTAKKEVDALFGRDIEIKKHINFDPGALDNVWVNNCCAVGLCANFVEPLEATSIGTTIQQMFLLMHRLPNYSQKTIDIYNKEITGIMDNIRDFIIMHYITKKTNSQFWKDVSQIKIPDTLQERLDRFKYNLPIEEDFRNVSKYALFGAAHYIHIMYGLDLFDISAIKNEYNSMHSAIRTHAIETLEEVALYDKVQPSVDHKTFLNIIRQTYDRKIA